jgi:hypothetical protein
VSGIRIISRDAILAGRRARGDKVKHCDFSKLPQPVKRLITTADGLGVLATGITINVNEGRLDNPTLYEPLYQSTTNADFPRLVPTNLLGNAAVVFLQRFEGGEVKFGHIAKGSVSSVPIVNYSAGFEYTSEMLDFNETWAIDDFNRAFGEAYNALLNHIHLSPLLTFSYTGANQTPADATGATLLDKTRNTLIDAIRTAATAKRPGSILLASSANKYQLEDAIARRFDSVGNSLPAVSDISTIIYYDGHSLTVGPKTYSYAGVTAGKAYLLQPKRRLRELVKRDLFIETGSPDTSRRIEDQIVAHTYRGAYVDVAGSTEEITLP